MTPLEAWTTRGHTALSGYARLSICLLPLDEGGRTSCEHASCLEGGPWRGDDRFQALRAYATLQHPLLFHGVMSNTVRSEGCVGLAGVCKVGAVKSMTEKSHVYVLTSYMHKYISSHRVRHVQNPTSRERYTHRWTRPEWANISKSAARAGGFLRPSNPDGIVRRTGYSATSRLEDTTGQIRGMVMGSWINSRPSSS